MAFEIEKIPEDKVGKYGLGKSWVIDHERNAFLIRASGIMEAHFYDLYWNGEIINIDVSDIEKPREIKEGQINVYDIDLKFHSVKIPEKIYSKKEEILKMVEESLTKYGFACRPEKTGIVSMINLDGSVTKCVEKTRSRVSRA